MIVYIEPHKGIKLTIYGKYKRGEPEVGLSPSFEVRGISHDAGAEVFDLLEWSDSCRGNALEKITELCLEQLNNQT